MIDQAIAASLFAFAIQAGDYTAWCRTTDYCQRAPEVMRASLPTKHRGMAPVDRNVAVVNSDIDLGSLGGRSVVVHEYVHRLQIASGRYTWASCFDRAAMEQQAEDVQEAYLRRHGARLSQPVAERSSSLIRAQCERARAAGLLK